jgi:predicted nucleotidyltransferase
MSDTETVLAREISRERLIGELRELRPLFEQEGVTRMILFDSRARRDNRADSDVDVAIELDPGRKFSLVERSGVGLAIEDSIGLRGNVFMRRSLKPSLQSAIDRDGIAVF